MFRVALIGCTAAMLFGSALQALAAPPSETKRRSAAVRPATAVPVPRPVTRPAAVTRHAAPAPRSVVTPVSRVILRPLKTPSVVKAAAKPAAKTPAQSLPRSITKTAAQPAGSTGAKPAGQDVRPAPKLAARFDRSTRSSLLPAGSPQLLQKGSQPLSAQPRLPAGAGPLKPGAAKKIAGAVAGAAVIGAGAALLPKPGAASALSTASTGPVRPAAKLPLANLNHPHVKPVARVLPSILGHKHANRPRLPLFVLAPALLGAGWMGREFYVWNRRSYDNVGWIAPIPSCYVGGTVFYRNPWSGECFNFETAEPGERFAVGTKVYSWTPAKYASVEDMVDDQERTGASVMADPFRIANPTAPVTRVSTEPMSRPALSLEATDCSSCLTAIGPVEVTGGQCSVTISNNCGLPVAFDVEFQRNGQTFCQTKLDAASASEVIVCTQPCTAFLEARVNLKSAMPKLANTAPFKGCRPHWAALEDQAR
jgi:hypothetical protein